MTIYTLYVKTHRKTGLKYLGQTSHDPFKYLGSGTDWKLHLKKFGNEVNTEIIFQTADKKERNRQGVYYSTLWSVVTASDDFGNKIWANRIPETGSGQCPKGREPWNKGKKTAQIPWNKGLSKETSISIQKQSEKMSGRASGQRGKTKETDPSIARMSAALTGRTKENNNGRKKQAIALSGRTKENDIARKNQSQKISALWVITNNVSSLEIIINGSELNAWCACQGLTRNALMSAYYRGKSYNGYTVIKLMDRHGRPSKSSQVRTDRS